MKHIIFEENTAYKMALLIKESALIKPELEKHYLSKTSLAPKDIIAFSLDYKGKKAPVAFAKAYLQNLLKALKGLGTTTMVVCDSAYYKILTGVRKIEGSHGYVKKCAIEGYEDMDVILSLNYQSLYYNPDASTQIDMSMNVAEEHLEGFYMPLGSNIIHSAEYPEDLSDIAQILNKLHDYPALACDIETFSLKFYETGIATIGFAWDEHNGVAFPVDYVPVHTCARETGLTTYGVNIPSPGIKRLLLEFFKTYKGRLTFHNANFDVKVMINDLFMYTLTDQDGMLEGIQTFAETTDDTKLITYLATNSTAGNQLGLKHLAHEFAGNYAEEEINDITKIPMPDLLEYNLKDCLCTNYVRDKYYPLMVEDNQETIYAFLFLPSMVNILQMELTGTPIDMDQVNDTEKQLLQIQDEAIHDIFQSKYISYAQNLIEFRIHKKDFEDRRKKAKHPENIKPKDIANIVNEFNVGSPKQLGVLLYEIIGLPVIDLTDTKQPATGAKTLEKLVNHTDNPDVQDLLNNIIKYSKAAKITSTFIKAFKENSVLKDDGCWYLHGNFNLGGTVSGRLSSSKPNLQNIPSGSYYAKLIKKCFIAPAGWIFCGADFDSLEDRISALTTKDPNKLKVYEERFDGHSLRAYKYFGDQMPDIENTVESINSIAKKYPELRQASKAPTFALTYQGTYHTLMSNLGLSEKEALSIESNYHELYEVSDQWVQDKLQKATELGYVEVAFGLRVRTPILAQSILNKKSTPYEAQAEGRTAGNALGQSYGLLNNRAGVEFQRRVLASEHRNNIKPIMQIHDAMYFIVKNDLDTMKWFNDNLPECMNWDKLSELYHETVKLSGAVEIFYPNWANSIDLPNGASRDEIWSICKQAQQELA